MTKRSPFRYFKTSPEIFHLAVMLLTLQFQAQPHRRSRWVAPTWCGLKDSHAGLVETSSHSS